MSLFDAERSSSMEELAKLRLEIERLLEENCALQDKLNVSDCLPNTLIQRVAVNISVALAVLVTDIEDQL